MIFAALLLALFLVKYTPARKIVSEWDYVYLDGFIFRSLDRGNGGLHRDKTLYNQKLPEFDYDWISDEFLWVAHGLGGEGELNNTRESFEIARDSGMKYFEIDIRLVNEKIYCSHKAVNNLTHSPSSCSLDWIIKTSKLDSVWFVLDVKSNFVSTYEFISKRLRVYEPGYRLIPQIYSFEQLKYLDPELYLGPIFTGYRQNLNSQFMMQTASSLALPIMTLPAQSIMDSELPNSILLLTHGISSTQSIEALKSAGLDGVYVKNSVYNRFRINQRQSKM